MYEIEYNGSAFEVQTEIAALAGAKHVINQNVGPVEGWAVEHDEVINVWFIQGLAGGTPVGPAATITGPEQSAAAAPMRYPAHVPANTPTTPDRGLYTAERDPEQWMRCVTFVGASPAEVFRRGMTWMIAHQDDLDVYDVGWAADARVPSRYRLTVYYRAFA